MPSYTIPKKASFGPSLQNPTALLDLMTQFLIEPPVTVIFNPCGQPSDGQLD